MMIKCVFNKQNELPEDLFNYKFTSNRELNVDIEKEYIVYGMLIHRGYIWYLHLEDDPTCPMANPSPAFEIIDGRLSRYWVFSTSAGKDAAHTRSIWTFPEWAHNEYYYDALTDGEEKEVEIFKKYKELMDLEFPLPSVTLLAKTIDNQWLMCSTCIDAWESISTDGMVICPSCKQMMHNPRYENFKA